MLFYLLYYDIISSTSLKITQAFHLLLGFVENQIVFWDFKIRNSVRITEGSDNRDLDNRGSTVYIYIYSIHIYVSIQLNLVHPMYSTVTMMSLTDCELFVINRDALSDVLHFYPDSKQCT